MPHHAQARKDRGREMIEGLSPIDRSSYEPAYVQLVNILSHAIARGDYRAGDQLPTEAELCEAFDVSPMTVRRVIGVLLDRGFVSTTRGRGTFVKPLQLHSATFELTAFRKLLDDPAAEARVRARERPASWSFTRVHLSSASGGSFGVAARSSSTTGNRSSTMPGSRRLKRNSV